jgi:hypothetical protein
MLFSGSQWSKDGNLFLHMQAIHGHSADCSWDLTEHVINLHSHLILTTQLSRRQKWSDNSGYRITQPWSVHLHILSTYWHFIYIKLCDMTSQVIYLYTWPIYPRGLTTCIIGLHAWPDRSFTWSVHDVIWPHIVVRIHSSSEHTDDLATQVIYVPNMWSDYTDDVSTKVSWLHMWFVYTSDLYSHLS